MSETDRGFDSETPTDTELLKELLSYENPNAEYYS